MADWAGRRTGLSPVGAVDGRLLRPGGFLDREEAVWPDDVLENDGFWGDRPGREGSELGGVDFPPEDMLVTVDADSLLVLLPPESPEGGRLGRPSGGWSWGEAIARTDSPCERKGRVEEERWART